MPRSRRYSSVYSRKSSKKGKGASRLAKKEQEQIQKQTVKYIFFGIVILLVFIFLLVPNIIKIFFNMTDQETLFEEKDEVPPQVPILSANPPEATYSATLNLKGYAEAGSKVVFVVNGQEIADIDVSEEGEFEHDLALDEGENEILLYGIDEAGNESLKTKSYFLTQDNEAPSITVESPEDGASIELKKNRQTEIVGSTEIGSKLYLNDRLVLVDSEGNFKTSYYLAEGENKLQFRAVDKAGNQSEKEITVKFQL
jgi:uncharacterized protein YfaP (DUF2135 family)